MAPCAVPVLHAWLAPRADVAPLLSAAVFGVCHDDAEAAPIFGEEGCAFALPLPLPGLVELEAAGEIGAHGSRAQAGVLEGGGPAVGPPAFEHIEGQHTRQSEKEDDAKSYADPLARLGSPGIGGWRGSGC